MSPKKSFANEIYRIPDTGLTFQSSIRYPVSCKCFAVFALPYPFLRMDSFIAFSPFNELGRSSILIPSTRHHSALVFSLYNLNNSATINDSLSSENTFGSKP